MPPNRQILLASRPTAFPVEANFQLVETPAPQPAEGQFLVRNHWLSLDPYMRGRMDAVKSYAKYLELGEVMTGGTVGEIAASRHPQFAVGEFVTGAFGWQEYALSDGTLVRKVDPKRAPLSYALGVLGMPGVTAWVGLLDIAQPKAGETVLVSAASGAVGSVVGQLAKAAGCRAVGIAGGPDKCHYVTSELGFDACIDHREHAEVQSMAKAIRAAAPKGVDGLFENVGGIGLDGALACMNPFGRVAVCGLIAGYEGTSIPIYNVFTLVAMRLTVRGFIVSDHLDVWPQALAELGRGVAEGKIRYRETVAEGLAAAPEAFIGMLKGRNFGKQLVKLA